METRGLKAKKIEITVYGIDESTIESTVEAMEEFMADFKQNGPGSYGIWTTRLRKSAMFDIQDKDIPVGVTPEIADQMNEPEMLVWRVA